MDEFRRKTVLHSTHLATTSLKTNELIERKGQGWHQRHDFDTKEKIIVKIFVVPVMADLVSLAGHWNESSNFYCSTDDPQYHGLINASWCSFNVLLKHPIFFHTVNFPMNTMQFRLCIFYISGKQRIFHLLIHYSNVTIVMRLKNTL